MVVPCACFPLSRNMTKRETMNHCKGTSLTIFIFLSVLLFAQDKQQIEAIRTSSNIKVDGVLDEDGWKTAPVITGFTENSPNPGKPAQEKTEVRLIYDDVSVYVGAILYDDKDSVLQQLCLRDEGPGGFRGEFGGTNTDWFGFSVDNYMDGINGLMFAVSAAGVQYDVKYSAQGGDKNWDAVWKSAVVQEDDKWIVEMEIPYSALRFAQADEQQWHVNFTRSVRRKRTRYWWSHIDPGVNGTFNQFGVLRGIKGVEPPIRLQATPFVAGTVTHFRDKNADPSQEVGRDFSAGMDIKYGINDAFTLDMSLIPDFGEVQSDNQVLNLSPFEIRFDENRPFFTEGTELFNKGDIFYSRRIGGRPTGFFSVYGELDDDEEIVSNPIETPLFNALKLSGRTSSGLGIGVFNGLVGKTSATVQNSAGESREVETNPITNYNVFVLDQNLKNNSYLSFSNASTLRFGKGYYDANVSAIEFRINNKSNSYVLTGGGNVSQQYGYNDDGSHRLGFSYNLSGGKRSGKLNYSLGYSVVSDTYDPNDLGFQFNNNNRTINGNVSFNQFEPFGKFNRARANVSWNYNMLYDPNVYSSFVVNTNVFFNTRKFFAFGGWMETTPIETHDYFEPRDGLQSYMNIPEYIAFGGWVSSDYRKKFAYDIRGSYATLYEGGNQEYSFFLSPRWRVSDKLLLVAGSANGWKVNDFGFTTYDESDNSIIGVRDIREMENTLSADYVFNNKMGLTLRVRHLWTRVNYESFHVLDDEGGLAASDYTGDHDVIFNAMNIDLVYRWRFAPGSDLVLVYKNAIIGADDINTMNNYVDTWRSIGDLPQTNTFTIKVLYFLDYYTLKNKWKQKKKD